jgi:hypothetical protein
MTAAYVLTWANLPIVAVVAQLVPFYMFSGAHCDNQGFALDVLVRSSHLDLALYMFACGTSSSDNATISILYCSYWCPACSPRCTVVNVLTSLLCSVCSLLQCTT